MSAEPDVGAPVTVAGRLSTYLRGGGIITPIITVIFAFIVGGLVVSQVLTLYTTPVVYLYLEKMRVNVNRRRGHTVADEVVPGAPVTDAGIPARNI